MNPLQKAGLCAAVVASTVVGGALGASLMGIAGAQEASTTTTAPAAQTAPAAPSTGTGSTQAPPSQGQPPAGGQMDPSKGGHQNNGITETLLSGDAADKVTAAAKEAVPGGTVQRVENDAEGATYEAHMTTSDGKQVTVKLDDTFKVTSVEDGMR